MLPFTLIAGSVWGAHYRIRGCRDLPWRATSSSRLHGWMGWLAEWWMRLPGEQPQRGLGSVWPPHSLQQAGPCCLYLGGRGGSGVGRQICSGIFSLRHLTWVCLQIYQFLAAVIFNGHIASFLTDLPLFVPASPFTSGCCVFRRIHASVCIPGSSGESRGRAAGSALRLCALMAELHREAPSC